MLLKHTLTELNFFFRDKRNKLIKILYSVTIEEKGLFDQTPKNPIIDTPINEHSPKAVASPFFD